MESIRMNPEEIKLTSTSRMFEYEKLSRQIETCDDIEELKNMLRCYVKLHMKTQEFVKELMLQK